MRAIMALNEKLRAKIIRSNNTNQNFDHLKIECRVKDAQNQHEAFGEELFNIMKSVKTNILKNIFLKNVSFFSFHLKVTQVISHLINMANVLIIH